MNPAVLAAQNVPLVLLGFAVLAVLCSAAVAPSIPEMRQKRAALLREAETFIAKADAEKRDLTDEEEKAVSDRTDEAARILADVERMERRQALRTSVASGVAGLTRPLGPKSVETTGPAALGTAPAVAREAWLDDPMRGFRSHRDFFLSVKAAGHGASISPQLRSLSARYGCQADGSPVLATAGSDEQSGFNDPYGGFLVPKVTQPGVLTTPVEGNQLAGYCRRVPMGAPKVGFNARVDKNHSTSVSGGLRVYRRSEAQAVAASRMSFEQVELAADPMMGVAFSTEELLADSPESIIAILEGGFNDEFGAKEAEEILNGKGAGEYLGVSQSPALITVSKEAGQAADTLVWANLAKMRARCYGYRNAVWVGNPDILPQLMSIVQPGSTIPMFTQDAQGVDRLFGRPIVFSEFAASIGDLGDLILLNLGEYLLGEYEPIRGMTSYHVRFVEHEAAFKLSKRCAGAPWWRTALTPKRGATLSPIVYLEARA